MTDTELLNILIDELHNEKWTDTLPWLRPNGDYTEKYIDRKTFKSILIEWAKKHNIQP